MNWQNRTQTIETLKNRLVNPRLHISAILLLTALATFLTSAILLRIGLTEMGLRYPIAVIAGYLAFLVLLRIWIWLQNSERRIPDIDIDEDALFALNDLPIPGIRGGGAVKEPLFGGGGDFAGGGAGGSISDVGDAVPTRMAFSSAGSNVGSGSGSSASGIFDIDLDDGLALLIVLFVLLLIFSALIYVIWIAPVLLAELLIDAAVVSALYKPVRNIERRHWLMTALRKTAIPAVIVVILSFIAGVVMTAAEPDAVTIGQFIKAVL